jgi:predicted ATP-grasp superfamily ATP-dependent carboligase
MPRTAPEPYESNTSSRVEENARRPRVLLTEGASLSARQVLYALGPDCDIDVLDPDPLCQCRFSSLVRRWIRSPSFASRPEEFLDFLIEILREENYDVLLPTHDQVYLLSRFGDALASHVGLALPDFASLEKLQDKARFKRLLDELGLPQPQSTIVRSRADLDRPWQFPLYLKLAHSTAGAGVFLIDDRPSLDRRIDQLERDGLFNGQNELLIQQPAAGVQATVQAVFDRGRIVGIHSFESRRLGIGGMSSARVSVDHPVVRDHVAHLGQHLAWHGALFLDYFFDHPSNRPQYIEANPRIGETVNALLSGVNLPDLLLRVSRGESPQQGPLGKTGVRTQSFFMILLSMALDGGGRWDLLREIRRFQSGRGLYENSQDELTRPGADPFSRLPRFWIAAQLLAWPGMARKIVAKTVKNYSLPESATESIKALPLDRLDRRPKNSA